MVALGGWSCIVRFACHIPMGIVGFGGRALYDTVKDLDRTGIYDVIANGRAFLYGLQMYSTWGIFGFAWNFAMFLGCFACSSWLLVLLGLVDSMIATALAISAAKQAEFLPTTYHACVGATDWRNGTEGRNYFLTANSTAFADYGGPGDLCHEMVYTWALTVAVVALYGLTGIINIALGLATAYWDHEDHRRAYVYRSSPPAYNAASANRTGRAGWYQGFGRFMLWLSTPALRVLDHPLAACRFGFRYMCKAFETRNSREHDGKGVRHKKKPLAGKHAESHVDSGEPPGLPSELLVKISQQRLHLVDLVSASNASKKLRMELFGSEDAVVPEQLEDLGEITCQGRTRSSCGICGIQTCAGCQTKRAVAPSLASQHLTDCRPYCFKCFYKTYCRWWGPQGQRLARHADTCGLRDRQTDVEMVVGPVRAAAKIETLCRMCASMTQAERKDKLEARDAMELDRLARHPLACAKCKEILPGRGPRWWICHQCFTECPSKMHPPWAAS
ncbi:hypothetical protein VTK56DRAFT_5270 [Thermocarpiscus australiensis]